MKSIFAFTVCNLQQGFGDHTASDVQSLTAVVASVRTLHRRDGQIARLRDREPTGGRRRLRGEQEVLEKGKRKQNKNRTKKKF